MSWSSTTKISKRSVWSALYGLICHFQRQVAKHPSCSLSVLHKAQDKMVNECPIQTQAGICDLLHRECSCAIETERNLVSIPHMPENSLFILFFLFFSVLLVFLISVTLTQTPDCHRIVYLYFPVPPIHFDRIIFWCIDKEHQQGLISNSATCDRTAVYWIVCSKQPCFVAAPFYDDLGQALSTQLNSCSVAFLHDLKENWHLICLK